MKNTIKTTCFLLAFALLTGVETRAQLSPDLIMETYNSNISVITDGAINKSVLENSMKRNTAADRSAGRGTAASRRLMSTAYTPTPALRQQTVQACVDRLQASSPAGAQAVAAAFGPGKYDYSQTYREILKGTGLRENDATDALACYMLMGWAVAHNVQDDKAITIPMAQGVRDQIAPLLTTSAKLRTRAAQIGEEMKLQTVLVQGGWQAAIKQGKLAAYQQSINNMFKTKYGMDMNEFKLTSQGFAKK